MRDQHDTRSTAGAVWTVEPLAFRLRAPLHVGWRKVGNLMQARPYLPARNLWAALTARLTRQRGGQDYQAVGDEVKASLVFSYFFPALTPDPTQALYPWLPAAHFDYLFLDSYASTALGAGNAAEVGSLHETEMLRPRTRPLADTALAGRWGGTADELGAPVYLVGYAVVRGEGPAGWESALAQLQVGGERRSGWGRLQVVGESGGKAGDLFDRYELADAGADRPVIRAREAASLLAHALAAPFDGAGAVAGVTGEVEPLVGRETRVGGKGVAFGRDVLQARVCWTPGATVAAGQRFAVGPDGVWQAEVKDAVPGGV